MRIHSPMTAGVLAREVVASSCSCSLLGPFSREVSCCSSSCMLGISQKLAGSQKEQLATPTNLQTTSYNLTALGTKNSVTGSKHSSKLKQIRFDAFQESAPSAAISTLLCRRPAGAFLAHHCRAHVGALDGFLSPRLL